MQEDNLSQSMEDYIEAIYIIEKNNKIARVTDVGKELNVRKASVVSALNYLKSINVITHEHYGYITLTRKGTEIAERVYKKHRLLYDFLSRTLNVDREKAKKEACAIEHALSEDTVEKIVSFVKYANSLIKKNTKTKKKRNKKH
ncbi:MAG: metal-dependent transcriptional regulator [Candidatus Goldbacteria bacterium]|nr:metal-dependent transcriptional regulator [Candidatus Goldiibacteriota bacterium]